MTEIYLLRHSETSWSKTRQYASVSDIPLTDLGKSQAVSLGKVFQKIRFAHVFSSPKKRALETATLAGLPPEIDSDLVEWNYGDYEGKTRAEIGPEWYLFRDGAPNGESPDQIQMRADRVLKKLRGLAGPIAIFTHGHFLTVLTARWLELDVSAGGLFYISVASLNILGWEDDRPILKKWNSTCHLDSLTKDP